MVAMDFGKLISKLLNYTGTKNQALALELGYDVSYISKMVNSKIYPASKNANLIWQKTAAFITAEATDSARHAIQNFLEIPAAENGNAMDEKKKFQEAVEEQLFSSYLYSTEKSPVDADASPCLDNAYQKFTDKPNSYTLVNPRLRRKYLHIPIDEHITAENPLDLIMLTSLFEISRDDKLNLAGIRGNDINLVRPELMKFRLILSITDIKKADLIFDPILFINMVTNFSNTNFSIYATDFSFYSMALSVKNHFAHFGIPGRNGKLLIATTSDEPTVIQDTYDMLDELITISCHPVYSCHTPEEMIAGKLYMRYIIGKNIRVLIGAINELFLPSDLYEKVAQQVFGDQPEILNELKNIDVVLNNATYNSGMQVLLYEQTLNNYALTGELNFFNTKVTLSISERTAHINHIIYLMKTNPNIKIKTISGYFIEEFKQCKNPSCYLSSFISYLRINSDYTDKTLLVLKDQKMLNLFDSFYEEAWENRSDVVSHETIIPSLELALSYMELLDPQAEK